MELIRKTRMGGYKDEKQSQSTKGAKNSHLYLKPIVLLHIKL